MNPELRADEADVLEQQRDVREVTQDEEPSAAVEADPADVQEQSRAVPAEDEDWPGA